MIKLVNKYRYFEGTVTSKEDLFSVGANIFVFGSNLKAIHGSGSAKVAKEIFGAPNRGSGYGFTSELSYAIPTKITPYEQMTIEEISGYVNGFKFDADTFNMDTFLVTQVGCGLAGYTAKDIAPLFRGSPQNCIFDIAWKEYLE